MSDIWSPHILLVEDEILIGQSERLMLEDAGYRCTLSTTGEKALSFVQTHDDVDLVLMDIDLGSGISGIETARRMHETTDLPIVFLSSQTSPERVAETETISSYGFIVKGSTGPVMLAQIRMAFRLSHAREGERASELARRQSEARYRELFESSQVSLWLEDYSAMKDAVDALREQGVDDIDAYYREHPRDLEALSTTTRVIRANRATVQLYRAESEAHFRQEFRRIFPVDCYDGFRATVVAIASGDRHFEVTEQHLTFDGELLDVRVRWTVLAGDDGRYREVAMSVVDISGMTRALTQLASEKEHFEKLFHNAPVAIAVVNGEGRMHRVNPMFTEMFGYDQSEVIGHNALELIVPEGEQAVSSSLFERVRDGMRVAEEHLRQRKDGSPVHVLISGAVMNINGERYSFGIYQDIGPRKEAEALAERLLAEKTTLLHESHHRVKNNMAVVEGLLRLRAQTASPEAADTLEDAAARLHNMMILYDTLYRNERQGALDLRDFLTPMVNDIVQVASAGVQVHVDLDLAPVELDASVLSPLGIMVNELITNSMKYAFDGCTQGRISLSATQVQDNLRVQYADSGPGFGHSETAAVPHGFGLQLVSLLAGQIGADLRIDGDGGMHATITIPLPGAAD